MVTGQRRLLLVSLPRLSVVWMARNVSAAHLSGFGLGPDAGPVGGSRWQHRPRIRVLPTVLDGIPSGRGVSPASGSGCGSSPALSWTSSVVFRAPSGTSCSRGCQVSHCHRPPATHTARNSRIPPGLAGSASGAFRRADIFLRHQRSRSGYCFLFLRRLFPLRATRQAHIHQERLQGARPGHGHTSGQDRSRRHVTPRMTGQQQAPAPLGCGRWGSPG